MGGGQTDTQTDTFFCFKSLFPYSGICLGGHRLYISTIPPLVDRIGEENKIYPIRSRYCLGWGQSTGDITIVTIVTTASCDCHYRQYRYYRNRSAGSSS